jgi:hypothetical protein
MRDDTHDANDMCICSQQLTSTRSYISTIEPHIIPRPSLLVLSLREGDPLTLRCHVASLTSPHLSSPSLHYERQRDCKGSNLQYAGANASSFLPPIAHQLIDLPHCDSSCHYPSSLHQLFSHCFNINHMYMLSSLKYATLRISHSRADRLPQLTR